MKYKNNKSYLQIPLFFILLNFSFFFKINSSSNVMTLTKDTPFPPSSIEQIPLIQEASIQQPVATLTTGTTLQQPALIHPPMSRFSPKRLFLSKDKYKIHAPLKDFKLPGMIGDFPKSIDIIIKRLKIAPKSEPFKTNIMGTSQNQEISDFNSTLIENNELNRLVLYGPPGNGKTTITRKIASEANCRFREIVAADIISKFYGESAKNIDKIFVQIEEDYKKYKKKVVLFVDEINTLVATSDSNNYSEQVAAMEKFWTILDKYKSKDYFFLIGATNQFHKLDKTFVNRFGSNAIEIKNPDKTAREELFKFYFDKANIKYSKALPELLASKTEDFSSRAIEDCVITIKDNIDPKTNSIHCETVYDVIEEAKKTQSKIKASLLSKITLNNAGATVVIATPVVAAAKALYDKIKPEKSYCESCKNKSVCANCKKDIE